MAERSTARLTRWCFLVLAGAIHALCFAPGPLPSALLFLIQLVALGGLARAVLREPTRLGAFSAGLWFGLGNFAVGLYWVFISLHVYGEMAIWLSLLAVGVLALGLAVFPALASWLARVWAGPRPTPWAWPLAWASTWTLLEWVRGTIFTGFPWLNIGYAHVDGPLSGWAPLLGVYGVAWMAALVAAALGGLAGRTPGRRRTAAVCLVLAVVPALVLSQIGAWVQPAGEPLQVRLVQGNVEQSTKFDPALILGTLEQHRRQAAEPAAKPLDLIVLPETAIPLFQDQLPVERWDDWVQVAQLQNATLAAGVALHTREGDAPRYTNSVVALTGDTDPEALQAGQPPFHYDKAHLLPFGEYVPTGFRWFVEAMVMPMGDFNRGAPLQAPLLVGGQRLAFNICYEDVFGEELLPAVRPTADGRPGASILVNVSNLGWFGDSWALRQHGQIARMRAIETGRPMLRATNTGVTGLIDAQGELVAALSSSSKGVLDVSVQGMQGYTPYVLWGNWPAAVLVLLGLVAAGIGRLLVARTTHTPRRARPSTGPKA